MADERRFAPHIPSELLKKMIPEFNTLDALRFSGVCTHWCNTIQGYVSSSPFSTNQSHPFFQCPWLLLPPLERQEKERKENKVNEGDDRQEEEEKKPPLERQEKENKENEDDDRQEEEEKKENEGDGRQEEEKKEKKENEGDDRQGEEGKEKNENEDQVEGADAVAWFRFLNLEDGKIYKKQMSWMGQCSCVGSSHGWLVLIDKTANIFLFNPFSGKRISLPAIDTFDDFQRFTDDSRVGAYVRNALIPNRVSFLTLDGLREELIAKAILTEDPNLSSKSKGFRVFAIYNNEYKLAYARSGGDSWDDLAQSKGFLDVISQDNLVFALSFQFCILVWDTNLQPPTITMEINVDPHMWNQHHHMNREVLRNYYIVRFCEKLYLLVRLLDDVSSKGVEEALVQFQYKTTGFEAYSLEEEPMSLQPLWVRVNKLDDYVFFLGQNQSLSLATTDFPKLKLVDNTVFFTDDFRGHFSCSGHDFGSCMITAEITEAEPETTEAESILPVQNHKYKPSPYWVVLNPW